MPKVQNIGKQHFVQFFRLPVTWGTKLIVRGETNEINYPYRYAKPMILRLPFYYAFVFGKWIGQQDEETALQKAVQERILTNEDFEKGWTPPAVQIGEADSEYWDY
jgi:hypothetical protein